MSGNWLSLKNGVDGGIIIFSILILPACRKNTVCLKTVCFYCTQESICHTTNTMDGSFPFSLSKQENSPLGL